MNEIRISLQHRVGSQKTQWLTQGLRNENAVKGIAMHFRQGRYGCRVAGSDGKLYEAAAGNGKHQFVEING